MAYYPGNNNYPQNYASQPVTQNYQQQQYPQTYAPPPNPMGAQYPPAAPYGGNPYGGAGYGGGGYPPQQYSPNPYPPAPVPYAASPYPAPYAAPYPASPYPVAAAYPAASPYPVAVAPNYAVMPVMPAMNYMIQLKGSRLDRKDILSKSDPFVVLMASKHPGGYLSRQQIRHERKETKHQKKFGSHSGNWVSVHRTETIHNNQNPTWAPFTVNLYTLCAGNLDTAFKIEVWDADAHSDHDFIGSCVATIRDLQVTREIRLINKRRIGIFDSSGLIQVLKCQPM